MQFGTLTQLNCFTSLLKIRKSFEFNKESQNNEAGKRLDQVLNKNRFPLAILDKYLEQKKEFQSNWAGAENFNVYFCVLFDCYCQNLIS